MSPYRPLKIAAVLIGLLAAAAPPAAALAQDAAPVRAVAPARGTGPALWVVRDADSVLYLFGTMHLLRPTTAWGSDRIDRAFASASQLILEVAAPADQGVLMPLIRQHGLSPDRPLTDLLTAEEWSALDGVVRTIGSSADNMAQMRPWLAGVTVQSASVLRAGYAPESGVEPILKARAGARGMAVSGFESPDEQIRMLAGFPEEGQVAFLRRALETFDSAPTDVDLMVEAWAVGDVDALRAVAVDPLRATPLLYDALLVRRNTRWADQIEALLEGSGTVFIAVGAMHLAGDDSVQAILGRRGVPVETAP
jgi:uncharacterized protein YbaP (TraB family)